MNRSDRPITARALGTGLGAVFLLATTPAWAANITVDSAADSMQAGAPCTLREAIISANTNPAPATNGCVAGEPGADTISFADGVDRITLANGVLPTLADSVTINGPATIDANGQSRIFTNQTATTLNDLTLVNGMAAGDDADANSGGAILNDEGGVLTVSGGAMNNNTSSRAGGAIEEASGATVDDDGDDSNNDSDNVAVTLNNVSFSGNDAGTAPGNGGVLHVTGSTDIVINGGSFDTNTAVEGGALWNNGGTMTVDGATIANNSANGGDADDGDAEAQGGGGIFNEAGIVVVTGDTRIVNNSAAGDVSSGGGIFTNEGTTLNVTGARLAGNTANRAGGGIEVRAGASATLNGVELTANTANTTAGGGGGNGGGLHITGNGNADIQTALVANNSAAAEGGGLWNSQGEMNITAVSVINNTASGDDADQGGGGVFNQDGGGTVNIIDSRISGNVADGASGSGGGILNDAGATTNVASSEIAANTANRAGGGIENNAGRVTLTDVSLGGTGANFANDAGNNPGNGGGLHTGGAGSVVVSRSSISFNTAVEGGGLWNSGAGGLTINVSTVSNNSASGSTGGGIHQDGDGGITDANFVTVTRNSASGDGGGLAGPGSSRFFVVNSLVAENSSGGDNNDIGAGITNTDDDNNITAANAGLGILRLFGGTTATQPLLAGSAAVDVIADGACDQDISLDPDQRGAERPFDASDADDATNCDAGAFELTDNAVISVTSNNSDAVELGDDADNVVVLALTLANNGDQAVNVGGFSGSISVNSALPADFDFPDLDLGVFLDDNGNGQLDAGENPASATVNIDGNLGFTVQFDNGAGQSFLAGDSTSYLVVAQSSDDDMTAIGALPIYAGGALIALLGLFRIGGIRRRTQWLLLVAVLTVALTACSDSDADIDLGQGNNTGDNNGGNNGDDNDGDDGNNAGAPIQGDIQFVAFTVDAPTGGTDFIVGDGMPVRGPALTFSASDSDDSDDAN